MTKLQTMNPTLPLCDLVGKLKKIGRNDIARKLAPHVKKNVENLPTQEIVKLPFSEVKVYGSKDMQVTDN